MPSIIYSDSPVTRPRKGITAQVLIDGFSPGAPKEIFNIGPEQKLIASYLLERSRGFSRMPASCPDFVSLASSPSNIDQYRLAFGLTLLQDAIALRGRMGLKLKFGTSSAGRFINPAEQSSCIRFLEAIEGVDELEVRFRYREQNSIVRGNFLI
jgi:hypothetical protein